MHITNIPQYTPLISRISLMAAYNPVLTAEQQTP